MARHCRHRKHCTRSFFLRACVCADDGDGDMCAYSRALVRLFATILNHVVFQSFWFQLIFKSSCLYNTLKWLVCCFLRTLNLCTRTQNTYTQTHTFIYIFVSMCRFCFECFFVLFLFPFRKHSNKNKYNCIHIIIAILNGVLCTKS